MQTERLSVVKSRVEAVRRNLTVLDVASLTPGMKRVRLHGDELKGFSSPSPDDHVKVFFVLPDGSVHGRDYTPRAYDAMQNILTLDFALHEGGIGSEWAKNARPGMPLQIGGPRGTTVITAPGAWWLLIGDETSLPSIARRLEEMASGTTVITVIAVAEEQERLVFQSDAALTSRWVLRPRSMAASPEPTLALLRTLPFPSGLGFAWIAAEGSVAQAMRTYLTEERQHPSAWIKAASYWSAITNEQNS